MSWNLKAEFSKGFMEYVPNKGALLDYIAHRAMAIMDERTNRSRDAKNRQFKPYPKRFAWELKDPEKEPKNNKEFWDNVKRDENGHWKGIDVNKGRTVTLRSLEDVPAGRRMRDWLRARPENIISNRNANVVTLQPWAGRRDWKGNNVPHTQRAKTCVESGRQHIGLSEMEKRGIINEIMRNGIPIAFIEKRRKWQATQDQKKAEQKKNALNRRIKRAAKLANQTAEQKHKAFAKQRKRYGVPPDLGEQEAKEFISKAKKEKSAKRKAERLAKLKAERRRTRTTRFL